MHQLAIIIPAYKVRFFGKALESIAHQTNKNFHLYIGDDNSPDNLKAIVDEFKDQINLTYVKFEENIGSKDLVAQWERCISLSKGEEWIWLFSDDDVMDPNCVESFYRNVSYNSPPLLYHFNVDVIDDKGRICEAPRYFPEELSSIDFLLGKLKAKYRSYVVEYIFNRKAYEDVGGFPKFDLAWNSDDAMWFQLAEKSLIKTIKKSKVYWRASGLNLSRIKDNKLIAANKLNADLKFATWIKYRLTVLAKSRIRLNKQLNYWFFARLHRAKGILSKRQISNYQSTFHEQINAPISTLIPRLKINVIQSELYRTLVKIKKSILG